MYKATITVKLRPSILDPEGKAIEHALHSLSLSAISSVRVGKQIELLVSSADEASAKMTVEEACKKLLSNQVMEDYFFTVEKCME